MLFTSPVSVDMICGNKKGIKMLFTSPISMAMIWRKIKRN
jgi:hypothetical protein